MTPAGTTDDAFLGGKLAILQPEAGYRAGLDAVLLAAATPIAAGKAVRVLDAGAGVGVVGLCIAARLPDAAVTLVEREPTLADLASRNAERNGLADRVKVIVADVGAGGRALHDGGSQAGLAPGAFDHVVANPPYYAVGAGTASAHRIRAGAHQMAKGDLDRWGAFLATAARSDGTVTLIHRADALAAVLAALEGRFGGISVLPVHPRAGEPAHRIIVTGVKGSRAPLVIKAGLVLHDADGRYLPAVEVVLRDGAPLAA